MADLTLNPCSGCVAQAAYSKLLISDDASDFTASGGAKRLHFLGENLKKYVRKRDAQEITGDLWRLASRIYAGQDFIYGPTYHAMNAGDMEVLLPYLIGTLDAGTGGTDNLYEPDTCASAANLLILRDYGIFKYTDVYAASIQIDSRALAFQEESLADMVVIAINWLGSARNFYTDASYWPVADEPELGTTAAYAPYWFKHSSIKMRNTSFDAYCKSVRLVIDKQLQPRYRMSVSPTAVCSYGRNVDMLAGLDWNSTTKALLEQATNLPGLLKFSSSEAGTYYTKFVFSALVAVDEDPVSPNRRSDVEWGVRSIAAVDDPTTEFDVYVENKSA